MNIRDRVKELRRVPASQLQPNPKNWRTHPEAQANALRGILAEVGIAGAVLARETESGGLMLIDGHLRAETLQNVEVPVLVLDVNEEEADKLLATIDPLGAMAEADAAKLDELLRNVETGNEDLAQMLEDLAEQAGCLDGLGEPEVVEDEVPEPPVDPITKPGDLWLLGDHRLLCGDSTKPEDVGRLMAGCSPSFVLADPPYFGKVEAEWDNCFDGYEGFLEFLDGVFGLWIPLLLDRGTSGWWCAPDFAWHIEERLRKHAAIFNHIVWTKGKSLGTMQCVEEMRRWRPRSERLLLCEQRHSPDALLASFNAKTSHIASRTAYASIIDRMIKWREDAGITSREIDKCLGTNGMAGHYFGRSQWMLPTQEAWNKLRPLFRSKGVDIGEFDAQRAEFDAQRREFDAQRAEFDAQRREFDAQRREFDAQTLDNLTDVWEMPAPHGEDRHGHPTPKPMSLISKLVSAHSRPDDLVADPFLGSGTTLIAAEQLGRKCYGMEISPAYCDVIVKRWEALTGRQATREEG